MCATYSVSIQSTRESPFDGEPNGNIDNHFNHNYFVLLLVALSCLAKDYVIPSSTCLSKEKPLAHLLVGS